MKTLNNSVDNLEWCTYEYNINYDGAKQRMIEGQKNKKVYQYDLNNNLINIWPSTAECERNGFSRASLWRCIHNINKQYKGYKWSYVPL